MASDMPVEVVPRLSRRAGDAILANASNSTLILGRDRRGDVGSGYGNDPGAAAAHLIVGRRGRDPSVGDDAGTVYLSARTDPDAQAGTEAIGSSFQGTSGLILRADCVRIVPRKDLKISVGAAYVTISADGTIVLDGSIQLGAGAAERLLRGDTFRRLYEDHVHPTPVGPSGKPLPLPDSVLSQRPVRVL